MFFLLKIDFDRHNKRLTKKDFRQSSWFFWNLGFSFGPPSTAKAIRDLPSNNSGFDLAVSIGLPGE